MNKRYDNLVIIFIVSFFMIFIFFLFFLLSINKKYSKYFLIGGSYVLNDVSSFNVNDRDLRYLEKNKYIYYRSRKVKVEIVSVLRDAYKDKNIKNQILLRFKLDKSDKSVVYISIYRKKISFFDLVLESWKE